MMTVVYVAFAQACGGDSNESAFSLNSFNVAAPT